jgi:hypothetical protein
MTRLDDGAEMYHRRHHPHDDIDDPPDQDDDQDRDTSSLSLAEFIRSGQEQHEKTDEDPDAV